MSAEDNLTLCQAALRALTRLCAGWMRFRLIFVYQHCFQLLDAFGRSLGRIVFCTLRRLVTQQGSVSWFGFGSSTHGLLPSTEALPVLLWLVLRQVASNKHYHCQRCGPDIPDTFESQRHMNLLCFLDALTDFDG